MMGGRRIDDGTPRRVLPGEIAAHDMPV